MNKRYLFEKYFAFYIYFFINMCYTYKRRKKLVEVIVIKSLLFAARGRIVALLEKYFSGETMDYHQIIAIIVPIFVDQAFIIGLNIANSAMISSAGVSAISAVSMVDSLNVFLLNVFIAIATGGTVIVAQFKGHGDMKMVTRAASSTITGICLMTLIIAGAVIIFHTQLLNLLFGGAEPDVFNNARIYMIGSAISFPCFAIFEAACGALRGISDTKSSLGLSLIMNITYVLLNLLFINVLHMGVLGMVIAVNIARALGMTCALIYMLKFNTTLGVKIKSLFRLDFPVIRKVLSIGMPFAAEQMFFNGGKILTQTFIVQLGTLSIAVNAICGNMTMLLQVGASALSLSIITVVGQCMGRREIADAKKFIKSFVVLGSITFAVGALIFLPLSGFIVQIFSPPTEIVPIILRIILITSIGQIALWSMSFIIPSALRAAGDSKFTSLTSMLSMWLFRVVLGYVLAIVFKFGITGVWIAMVLEWVVRGTVFMKRLHGTKWCKHDLIGSDSENDDSEKLKDSP